MSEVASAYVTLIPSFKGGSKAIENELSPGADAAGARVGRKAGDGVKKGMGSSLKGGGTSLFASFIGAGAIALVGDAIGASTDLNETVSKSKVIFGDGQAAVDTWAKSAAKNLGLSRAAALGTASDFGNMFNQLGFGAKTASKMSTSVVELAADLGSFNNLPTAEVTDMMSAAFRGEYDSLQRLIPNINAARVEQVAMEMTGKKSAKTLTAQEKAAATLAIVTKDGAKAQGDFARTADGAANKSKILTAKMEDTKAAIGDKLAPAFSKLLDIGLKVTDWVTAHPSAVNALLAAVGALTVGVILMNLAFLANPFGLIVLAIVAVVAAFVYAYGESERFRDIVGIAFTTIKLGALQLALVAVTAFRILADAFLGLVSILVNAAAKAFGWVPGLGPQLQTAAANVDSFKTNANKSLSKIEKDLKVNIDTAQATDAAARAAANWRNQDWTARPVLVWKNPAMPSFVGNPMLAKPRERGGPVTKGETYIVGEKRPELFVPDVNGQILPQVPGNREVASSTSASDSSGGPSTFHIYDTDGVLLGTMAGAAKAANASQARDVRYGGR